jgi:hypothetical protein
MWMGVKDQGNWGCLILRRLIAAFQPAYRAVKNNFWHLNSGSKFLTKSVGNSVSALDDEALDSYNSLELFKTGISCQTCLKRLHKQLRAPISSKLRKKVDLASDPST